MLAESLIDESLFGNEKRLNDIDLSEQDPNEPHSNNIVNQNFNSGIEHMLADLGEVAKHQGYNLDESCSSLSSSNIIVEFPGGTSSKKGLNTKKRNKTGIISQYL